MRRRTAGSIIGLVCGLALSLLFWVPLFWIGPKEVFGLLPGLSREPEFPGGREAVHALLGFVLTVPVAGGALTLAALVGLRKAGSGMRERRVPIS